MQLSGHDSPVKLAHKCNHHSPYRPNCAYTTSTSFSLLSPLPQSKLKGEEYHSQMELRD